VLARAAHDDLALSHGYRSARRRTTEEGRPARSVPPRSFVRF
jgi:hypothetical protein